MLGYILVADILDITLAFKTGKWQTTIQGLAFEKEDISNFSQSEHLIDPYSDVIVP